MAAVKTVKQQHEKAHEKGVRQHDFNLPNTNKIQQADIAHVIIELSGTSNSNKVKVSPESIRAAEASSHCTDSGGIPAEPKSQEQHDSIKSILTESTWIGITDIDGDNTWEYASDFSALVFDSWAASPGRRRCVVMDSTRNYDWVTLYNQNDDPRSCDDTTDSNRFAYGIGKIRFTYSIRKNKYINVISSDKPTYIISTTNSSNKLIYINSNNVFIFAFSKNKYIYCLGNGTPTYIINTTDSSNKYFRSIKFTNVIGNNRFNFINNTISYVISNSKLIYVIRTANFSNNSKFTNVDRKDKFIYVFGYNRFIILINNYELNSVIFKNNFTNVVR
ncbi:hypothetical protein Bbelb_415290 [Branchiostoma belcheri]|nr:hypothetical protein Bbelb_415290 [Branchiostoma belcheri]